MITDNLNVDSLSIYFFQKFDIWPILVRVDYSPCRVDLAALSGGKYVELVNLVPWKVIFHSLLSYLLCGLVIVFLCFKRSFLRYVNKFCYIVLI